MGKPPIALISSYSIQIRQRCQRRIAKIREPPPTSLHLEVLTIVSR